MRLRDAIDMLADSRVEARVPTIWADLGCGDGTFTLALAHLLARGSVIHAMDLDGATLRNIPSANTGVGITTHRGNFTKQPWPFADLDGILMANSLHFVEHQAVFIRDCESHMKPQRRFLIVEYDTSTASRWVPYPVSLTSVTALFKRAGYSSMRVLRRSSSARIAVVVYLSVVTPDSCESWRR